MSKKLFEDVAARTPCTCIDHPIYYRDGCECGPCEKVCKAHLHGVAVESLTTEQRAYLIRDADALDPGPWPSATKTDAGDDEIAGDWLNALSNYVSSIR